MVHRRNPDTGFGPGGGADRPRAAGTRDGWAGWGVRPMDVGVPGRIHR